MDFLYNLLTSAQKTGSLLVELSWQYLRRSADELCYAVYHTKRPSLSTARCVSESSVLSEHVASVHLQQKFASDTARIERAAGFNATVERPSVRLSHHSAAARRCGEFAAVCPAAMRCQSILLHGRRSAAAAPQHGAQQPVSRCQLTYEAEHRLVRTAFERTEVTFSPDGTVCTQTTPCHSNYWIALLYYSTCIATDAIAPAALKRHAPRMAISVLFGDRRCRRDGI